MKILGDKTVVSVEQTVQHNYGSGQKAPATVKAYDSSGHWILVLYQSGAPASWVGQYQWVQNWLLTSS